MMRGWKLIVSALLACAPGVAHATQQFHLVYTTFDDGATSGPAVKVDALLTTDEGQTYGAPGFQVQSISGTRGSDAISFDPATFDDEIYYPGDAYGNYVDSFGLDFIAGGVTYTLYRNGQQNDFAYHEYDGSTGRIVYPASLTLAPASVPETATWAMLLVGFGAIGAAHRRQRAGARALLRG